MLQRFVRGRDPARRVVGALLVAVLVLALVAGAAHAFDCDHHADGATAPCDACVLVATGILLHAPDGQVSVADDPATNWFLDLHEAPPRGRLAPRTVLARAPPAPAVHG